jgi:hypothetical protein
MKTGTETIGVARLMRRKEKKQNLQQARADQEKWEES